MSFRIFTKIYVSSILQNIPPRPQLPAQQLQAQITVLQQQVQTQATQHQQQLQAQVTQHQQQLEAQVTQHQQQLQAAITQYQQQHISDINDIVRIVIDQMVNQI
ncbi:unnamed protein product [Rotaria socialis]|uniref:Uncharacterized protein n=2 Tax=Rotaria socialis TaxID=392032 RepID=A0A820R0T7_9BILA|nr:unnamed protein product [Rotaria socialis]